MVRHSLLILVLVIFAFPIGTSFADAARDRTPAACLDFEDHPRYLSTVPLERATGAAMLGEHVLVADVGQGLVVLDIADPRRPTILSSYPGDGSRFSAYDVEVRDDLAFLVIDVPEIGGHGLAVFDLSDPSAPELVSTLMGFTPSDVEVVGDALCTVGAYDFRMLDASDPTQVRTMGPRLNFEGHSSEVEVQDTFAYVATTEGALLIVDVSDPAYPRGVSLLQVSRALSGVAVDGDLVYVTASGEGLFVIDVTDRTAPRIVGSSPTSDISRPVGTIGTHVLMGDADAGMQVIDVSDPRHPRMVSRIRAARLIGGEIVSHGNLVFLSGWNTGFQIHDLSATAPQPILSHRSPEFEGPYTGAARIEVEGRLLYATGRPALQIYAIRANRQLDLLSSLDLDQWSQNVEVHGGRAFLALGNRGMGIVDVSDPSAPRVLYPIGKEATAAASSVRDLTVLEDVALLPTNVDGGGLLAVDVSTPEHPRVLSSVPLPGAWEIDTWREWAYVSHSPESSISILDIQDPAHPVLVREMGLPIHPQCLAAAGGYVFAAPGFRDADWKTTLLAIDVSDPGAPDIVGEVEVPGGVEQLRAESGRLFAVLRYGGIAVFDISDPTAIVAVGAIDTPWTGSTTRGVALAAGRVYVSEEPGDLWVLPRPCGRGRPLTPDPSMAMQRGSSSRVSLVGPNPSPDAVRVSLTLEKAETVRASIFDVRGRRIRDLVGRRLEAGSHVLRWDGADLGGRTVAAGVYFLHIETPSRSEVRRLTILR